MPVGAARRLRVWPTSVIVTARCAAAAPCWVRACDIQLPVDHVAAGGDEELAGVDLGVVNGTLQRVGIVRHGVTPSPTAP